MEQNKNVAIIGPMKIIRELILNQYFQTKIKIKFGTYTRV